LGILLTAFFADASLGGNGLPEGITMGTAFLGQLIAAVVTIVWAGVASFILLKITQAVLGLRVTVDDETEGLDITSHGERSYDL
jgi:Amt family ammonium transporter